MAISSVTGDVSLLKKTYKKMVSKGEGARGDQFRMTVDGYSDLEFLVQNVQLPPVGREMIETFGPQGVKVQQQGRFKNDAEIPITFKEVLSGETFKAVRDWVKNKKYLQVTIAMMGEGQDSSSPNTTVVLDDCWLELEGVDLSVEDTAAIVKPAGTLHANWVSWCDDEEHTLGWGV